MASNILRQSSPSKSMGSLPQGCLVSSCGSTRTGAEIAGQGRYAPASDLSSIWVSSSAPPAAAPTTPTAPIARKPREERQDSTDQRDWAESSEPVLSHEPAEISDRADPIEPTDRELPMEPIDKAEPTEPTDSTDPTEPIDSTESFDHNDSSEPEEAQTVGRSGSFVMPAILPDGRPQVPVPQVLTVRYSHPPQVLTFVLSVALLTYSVRTRNFWLRALVKVSDVTAVLFASREKQGDVVSVCQAAL